MRNVVGVIFGVACLIAALLVTKITVDENTELRRKNMILINEKASVDIELGNAQIAMEQEADEISSFVIDLQELFANEYSLVEVNGEYEVAEPFTTFGHCYSSEKFSELFPINVTSESDEEEIILVLDLGFMSKELIKNQVQKITPSEDGLFHLKLRKNEKNMFKLEDGTYLTFVLK